MKPPPVHILVTIRKPELLPAALMVFKSIRVGFPSAKAIAYLNGSIGDPPMLDEWKAVDEMADESDVLVIPMKRTTHHEWVSELLSHETEPFIICDTDVTFWDLMEGTGWAGPIMGRYVPKFRDKFANAVTMPRIHTSLMYFDPVKLQELVTGYLTRFPVTYCTPRPNLIYPQYVPCPNDHCDPGTRTLFYDTCSMLYNAIGGEWFGDLPCSKYDHLGFGTISDLVAPAYPEMHFREEHFAIFDNPELMRGRWKRDEAFYKANAA